MVEDAGRDRRDHERFDARVRVKLKFDNVKNLRQFYTKDISHGGLFIVAEKPKPMGTQIEIVIYPPGVPLGFPLQGTVVHVVDAASAKSRGTAPGMGIRFADLTPDKVASIKAYIDSMGEIETEKTVVARGAAKELSLDDDDEPKPLPTAPTPVREDARPVELRLDNRDQLKKLFVKDLAKGTLFLRTPEVRAVGSSVSVHLIVEGMAKGLWLNASVVRVVMSSEKGKDASGMGLELTDFTSEKRHAVEEYMKGRAADIAVPGGEPGAAAAMPGADWSDTTDLNVAAGDGGALRKADAAGDGVASGGGEADELAEVTAVSAAPLTLAAKGAPAKGPAIPSLADLEKEKKDKRPAIATIDQLDAAIRDFENAATSKNYFDQLGLPASALLDEIKTSYFQMVRRFHPDPWQGNAPEATLEKLQNAQMHLRTIYDTLSHPQKRAAYEVSNGIEAEGGDPILQQAREKKRAEYRTAFARKFSDHITKGERLIEAAMEDIRGGKTKSALSNIRLALSFDPLNEKYRKLLKTVLDKGGKS